MPAVEVRAGDTLAAIAARTFPGADVRRFTELLDANPSLNVFEDLTEGLELELPSTEQIESFARPALTRISYAIGGARGFIGQTEATINRIAGELPPELQGYAREALELTSEANGILDDAETVLDDAQDQLRSYGGQATNLVSWLLSGRV